MEGAQLAGLFEHFKGIPRVAGVAERVREIRAFNRVMDETMLFFTYVATVFAVVIAFGSSTTAPHRPHRGAAASWRACGRWVSPAARSPHPARRLAVLTLAAIPLALRRPMDVRITSRVRCQNDLFRVPVVLAPQTYAFAVTVVLVSALLSAWRCAAGSTNWTWSPS